MNWPFFGLPGPLLIKRGIALANWVFSLSFPRISQARQGKKILGNLWVDLIENPKSNERKDREWGAEPFRSSGKCFWY